MFQARITWKGRFSRLAYVIVFLTVIGYAFFTFTQTKGIPGLLGRQRQIPGIGKTRSCALARGNRAETCSGNRLTGNRPREWKSAIG